MEYPKENEEFIKEFVRRSKSIYEKVFDSEYETTALINCALGLFIVPREKNVGKITEETFKKIPKESKNTYTSRGYTPYNKNVLLKHIRNSLTHGKFDLISDESNNISGIVIKDSDPKDSNQKFELEMSIDLFREIIIEYCSIILHNTGTNDKGRKTWE